MQIYVESLFSLKADMGSRKRKQFSLSTNDTGDSVGQSTRNVNLPIREENYISDEDKDAQKLEQERSYLTDNNKFFPELVTNIFSTLYYI